MIESHDAFIANATMMGAFRFWKVTWGGLGKVISLEQIGIAGVIHDPTCISCMSLEIQLVLLPCPATLAASMYPFGGEGTARVNSSYETQRFVLIFTSGEEEEEEDVDDDGSGLL